MITRRIIIFLMTTTVAFIQASASPLPDVRVSDNNRFLVTEDGTPFFYLADTAWELFHRLTQEEAATYLKDRADKNFTVIQAVIISEQNGLQVPNAYGALPLNDLDPSKPNEAYFEHVDWIINKAASLGLYTALLPAWGNAWQPDDSPFTPDNAEAYGEWLGKRYQNSPVIWVLGGDREPRTDRNRQVIRSLAEGLQRGSGGRQLIAFHPRGGQTSSRHFHNDQWLAFNMWQTGHAAMSVLLKERQLWKRIEADYALQPAKPIIDSEPLYEDHPIGFNRPEYGGDGTYANDAHIRKRIWWGVFAGGFGAAYGHHSVWQMYMPERKPVNAPLMTWQEALDRPGAKQMQHLRALIESRPMLTRVPDQSLVTDSLSGASHIAATRGDDYAFIYTAQGHPFTVNLGKISGDRVTANWFNPRIGESTEIGKFINSGTQHFTPPGEIGFGNDWVLVLDNSSKR